ncbi:DUF3040 domain-containing protein [Tomitella gaofuii]|uniref:DUF3040 domain-containing protein n=1 Tax=Tomitella gaofuii TaxID=2760083 RepID=UPI0015F9C9D0|nr:DUF3040 domain-containing protein [Tomitella gaofuii]
MPLSEHEQRMLDEIENALYEEDPKFASQVRGRRFGTPNAKRRIQALFIASVGLALLIVGVATSALHIGGFPVLAVIGFVVMFLGAVMLMLGTPWGRDKVPASPSAPGRAGAGPGKGGGAKGLKGRFSKPKSAGSFTERMEERFRRRFEG